MKKYRKKFSVSIKMKGVIKDPVAPGLVKPVLYDAERNLRNDASMWFYVGIIPQASVEWQIRNDRLM